MRLQQQCALVAGGVSEHQIGATYAIVLEDLFRHADRSSLFDDDGAPVAVIVVQGSWARLEATGCLAASLGASHLVGLPDQVDVQHVDSVDARGVTHIVPEPVDGFQVLEVRPHSVEQPAGLPLGLVAGAPAARLVFFGRSTADAALPPIRAEPLDAEELQVGGIRVDDALALFAVPRRWHLVASRPLCPRVRRRSRRRRKTR